MDHSFRDFRKPSNNRVTDFLERLTPSNAGAGDFRETNQIFRNLTVGVLEKDC
jgi:hypothetical protein